MFSTSRIFLMAAAAASVAVVAMSGHADARRHWDRVGKCREAVEGAATSKGILGLGSARARRAAQSNWEINVEDKYGPAFANFDYARDVQWDCKKGAIILAKCVVVAKPCAARLRG
jgi:methylmalonyl-CoA mutase cobalamin-binding subunit